MRMIISFLAAGAVVGCATAPQPPAQRSAKAEARLSEELAGLTAGEAVSCIPGYRSNDMITIDDDTVLFRDGTTRVWRNDLQGGGCPYLGSGAYAMVTRTSGSGLCRGDIAHVTDVRSGITVGSCVLGDFVPYSKS